MQKKILRKKETAQSGHQIQFCAETSVSNLTVKN